MCPEGVAEKVEMVECSTFSTAKRVQLIPHTFLKYSVKCYGMGPKVINHAFLIK